MKLVITGLFILLAGISAAAQNSPSAAAAAGRAEVDGMVTKDPGSEPVKKALIELIAENQGAGGNYTSVTGIDGAFHIEGILPGRYRLFVERTGLLEAEKHHARTEGRVLTFSAGQQVKDLQIRMQAAAVVRGRVTDEDGDPLSDAQVAVFRQTYISGHSHWEQAGAERTNDLGEYRISSLPAGNYFVSAAPPPDFKSLIESSGAAGRQAGTAAKAAEQAPSTTYQTTYYPGTSDRSQAAPIQLHAGDDFPVNFSFTPTPALSIRGSVVNLPPRTTAAIMLQSRDLNLGMNGAEMHKDGSFVIRDVAPGTYTILATVENGPVSMMARQSLQVSTSVEGVRLAPQPGGWIHGRLRLESKGGAGYDLDQIFLTLCAVDDDEALSTFTVADGFSHLTRVGRDGSFEWKNVPPGTYFVQLAEQGQATDWFLKSAVSGSRDLVDSGITVDGGALAVDLTASANGGLAEGIVIDQKGEPVPNAVVVAVPEVRLRGRIERYRKSVSDQSGRFVLHGIPPGDYTLMAWDSVDGEAYYNPEFVKSYEGRGIALHVGEGERKSLKVTAITAGDDQQ